VRAITIDHPGNPDVLTVTEVAEPVVGPNDVLIEVAAAGVNRADIAQRMGYYPPPAGAPPWPGMEVSGVIAVVGATSGSRLAVGDRVCALLPGGGYAERAVVDAQLVLPVPDNVDLVEAAGLPEVAATVWSNVFMNAGLAPGETLLVHGGSSGIGSMAIQIATAWGARVFATAGSPEKVDFCESLGAARGIDYRTTDFVQVVDELTEGRGVDVVLDVVGGDYLARNIAALANSTFNLNTLMAKRGRIWATTLRARPLAERAAIIEAVRVNVWPLLSDGRVRPVIDSVFPLSHAPDAHRLMESSKHLGKILLSVAED
jgi:putative PIG3 family NAD(P)H quinone oxidoreductase